MLNVLLGFPFFLGFFGLGFLRNMTINTDHQDRTVVSLRQGRQWMWSAKSPAGGRKGEAVPVSAAAAGPCAALASSAAEVHGLLCILLTVSGDTEPSTSCRCIVPSA